MKEKNTGILKSKEYCSIEILTSSICAKFLEVKLQFSNNVMNSKMISGTIQRANIERKSRLLQYLRRHRNILS
jgi:hypothetical protein